MLTATSIWVQIFVVVVSVPLLYWITALVQFLLEYQEKLKALYGVGCDKPQWLLGHINIFGPNQKAMLYMTSIMSKFPKCMQVWFGAAIVYLDCHHPEVIKPVLSTEEPKDELGYRFLKPWIGEGLLTSSGNRWRRNRRLLTPAFHFDILKHYLVVFNNTANTLVEKWRNRHDRIFSAEMFPDISRMSLDTVLQCILSKRSNCQLDVNNEYLSSVSTITEISMKRIFYLPYHSDWVFNLSHMGRKYQKALKAAHEYTESVVRERKAFIVQTGLALQEYISWRNEQKEKGEEVTIDFLDILLLAKDEGGVGLSHSEVCQEVDTFVFEGHDTVSSGLSWAFYNLAANPKHQELCRKEVQRVIGGRKYIEWDDLPNLTYLAMCIKESLRLCPPVFAISRRSSKPLFFPRGFGGDQYNLADKPSNDASRVMPPNFNFGINIFLLHRNPIVWKDPHRFDPERFTPDNVAKRSPHAYLPFSAGPRNCIGQHFAMNEMKVVIALALSQFRFSLDGSYPEPELEPYIILRSKTGINLKLEKL